MTKKEAVGFFKMAVASKDLPEHWREYLTIAIAELDRKYTSQPPTVPGGYWWRGDFGVGVLNEVKHVWLNWAGVAYTRRLDTGVAVEAKSLGGEWCGPLTSPE